VEDDPHPYSPLMNSLSMAVLLSCRDDGGRWLMKKVGKKQAGRQSLEELLPSLFVGSWTFTLFSVWAFT
jgi:hypothetical protein